MGVTGVMPLYFNDIAHRTGFVTGVTSVTEIAVCFLMWSRLSPSSKAQLQHSLLLVIFKPGFGEDNEVDWGLCGVADAVWSCFSPFSCRVPPLVWRHAGRFHRWLL